MMKMKMKMRMKRVPPRAERHRRKVAPGGRAVLDQSEVTAASA